MRLKRFINFIIDLFVIQFFALLIVQILLAFALFLQIQIEPNYILILLVTFFIYYLFLEYHGGKTFGKKVTKTKVKTVNGKDLSFKQAILRTLLRLTFIDIFTYLYYKENGWHDIFSKTAVIEDK